MKPGNTPPALLAPPIFDRDAYDRFRLARRIGEASAALDDPEMVSGSAAGHLRQDDYVVGLVFGDRPRAYPLWIIDHYHVINDRIGDDRIVVTSCERCQSGSAFESEIGGNAERPPLFRASGVLNAILVMKDLQTGSYWNHYDGVALRGRAAGARLRWIPTYHIEWADWLELHPDTEVMVPPYDPVHPDARHGHGREEIFARPGMDPAFIETIVGGLDDTYPENEMVLGIDDGSSWPAYPLREVQRAGGVVHADVLSGRVVVFAGPKPDGFTMGAFQSFVGETLLNFRREGGGWRDDLSDSRWTIEGRCVEGPYMGESLPPVRSFYVRWHAWIYAHRGARPFRSDRVIPMLGDSRTTGLIEGLEEPLARLAAGGGKVRIHGPMVSQRRPRESLSTLVVSVDGHRLNIHRFASAAAARDFAVLRGAWSGAPYRTRLNETRVRRLGSVVFESDPEKRFFDPAHIVPLPRDAVGWWPDLEAEWLDGDWEHEDAHPAVGERGFGEVLRALRAEGFDVIDVGFLPPGQLREDCVNGIALTIEADRFLLYRFPTSEQAAAYAAGERHALAGGPFVLRSTPSTMYLDENYEILYAGDQAIRWSTLLTNGRLTRALVGEFSAKRPVGTRS